MGAGEGAGEGEDEGTSPSRRLFCRWRCLSRLSEPSESGKGPVSRFSLRSRT